MASGYEVVTVQRPRITKMAELRVSTTKSLRKLADQVQQRHPEMGTHRHLRDAARALDMGLNTAADRHLEAAMHTLTPQTLLRHGIHDDDGHVLAKQDMTEVWRHSLMVKDLTDLHDETQGRLADIRAMRPPATTPVGQDRAVAEGPKFSGEKMLPPPRRTAQQAAAQSAGGSLIGMSTTRGSGVRARSPQVTDLAFNPSQPRDSEGRWSRSGVVVSKFQSFSYNGKPGSFEHGRAIMNLADTYQPVGELATPGYGPRAQMLSNSLKAAAEAMIRRDMNSVDIHLGDAAWAASHINAAARANVEAVKRSMAQVPRGANPGAYGRRGMTLLDVPSLNYKGAGSASGYLGTQFSNVDLSAQTARLAVTPAPRGKPGGPGLYNVKNLGHTPYFQQVVKALIEKRGLPPGRAYAIAYGALRKWRRGGGRVHPEVQAAATGALAGEAAKGALAKSMAQVCDAIELATVIDLFNPYHAPTGQFTTAQGAGQKQGKTKEQRKEALLGHAAALREKAHALQQQLHQLEASIKAGVRSGKTSAGTKAGSKASNPAPAKKGTPAKRGAAAASSAASRSSKAATIAGRIVALKAEIASLLAQARAATAAAAKL